MGNNVCSTATSSTPLFNRANGCTADDIANNTQNGSSVSTTSSTTTTGGTGTVNATSTVKATTATNATEATEATTATTSVSSACSAGEKKEAAAAEKPSGGGFCGSGAGSGGGDCLAGVLNFIGGVFNALVSGATKVLAIAQNPLAGLAQTISGCWGNKQK
jgi:Tfp pilus assembly major pilin PilA